MIISVTCDDSSHPTKLAKICEFVKRGDGWDSIRHRSGRAAERDKARPQLTQKYVGGERGLAARYRLECPLCGLNVIANETTLEPIFDTLDTQEPLTLAALAAKIAEQHK